MKVYTAYGSYKGHRGFVITLASLGLIMLLVAFSSTLHNNYLSLERALLEPRPLLYAAFIFDSVAQDLNTIAGPQINITQTNSSTRILIADTVPNENFSSQLASYESFIETILANETHSTIRANFSNMSAGMLRLSINGNYNYTNNQTGAEMLFISDGTGGTNATVYEIFVSIIKTRASVQNFVFDPGGDLNISITYTDLNGTGTASGKILSNQANNFVLTYDDGSRFTLLVGRTGSSNGALRINTQNLTANISFTVTLPAINETKKTGYEYDAVLEYVQGKVKKSGKIAK